MPTILSTFSANDLNFSLNSPLGITILAAGIDQKGWDEMTIEMDVDQTTLKVGADGAVVPSAIPGQNGKVGLKVWQTSTLHQQLLAWYNALVTARQSGDVSNWNTTTVLIVNTVDGTSHNCTGVAPLKVPPKTYGHEAQTVDWVLLCCNITNQ